MKIIVEERGDNFYVYYVCLLYTSSCIVLHTDILIFRLLLNVIDIFYGLKLIFIPLEPYLPPYNYQILMLIFLLNFFLHSYRNLLQICQCILAVSYTHLDVYKRQTYTTTRQRIRFSPMMAVDGTAETSDFAAREGILTTKYFFVADNVVHM